MGKKVDEFILGTICKSQREKRINFFNNLKLYHYDITEYQEEKLIKMIEELSGPLGVKEYEIEDNIIEEIKKGLSIEEVIENIDKKLSTGQVIRINTHTICELVDVAKAKTLDKELLSILDDIKYQANRMESRLLKYCNSIEDLGFIKINRDYKKQ